MSSTTPAPERAPRGTGAGEPARSVQGAPMRALLAACAAAEAVSTPPERREGAGAAGVPDEPAGPAARTPRAA
ncbi:hypothetical protein J5Y04_23605 [Kitasatospora sp. RG8]|uniref:hypothetical protein n=1 Tax=Kitasatospora sp. RG8 TaxID=2820815 RepID=UPI001ADF6B03|nr:hypothetical protein [Kitasatospora sp. RG8]MBP0452506.1 hypothetical protein [Kitasatospora sp. RG8]